MDARELRLSGVCSVATMDFTRVYHEGILKTADEIVLTIALHKGKIFCYDHTSHTAAAADTN